MRPHETLPKVAQFLGRELGPKTNKILKRERIPRPTITHGRAFSAHNWATSGEATERDVYELEMQYVNDHGSSEVIDRFRGIIRQYNQLWPSELNAFESID
jgi:hypothetical protein